MNRGSEIQNQEFITAQAATTAACPHREAGMFLQKVFLHCLPKETRRSGKWSLLHMHSQILCKSSFISIASFISRTLVIFSFLTCPITRRLEGQLRRPISSTLHTVVVSEVYSFFYIVCVAYNLYIKVYLNILYYDIFFFQNMP